MVTTLVLESFGGETKEWPVHAIEPEGYVIRWGFQLYTLHVNLNQLVRIQGNRVIKRLPWRAKDIETLRAAHWEWVKERRLTRK